MADFAANFVDCVFSHAKGEAADLDDLFMMRHFGSGGEVDDGGHRRRVFGDGNRKGGGAEGQGTGEDVLEMHVG